MENLFRFWQVIELLSPQKPDKPDLIRPQETNSGIFDAPIYGISVEAEKLPWEDEVHLSLRLVPGSTGWFYLLQCGIFDASGLNNQLFEKLSCGNTENVNTSQSSQICRLFDLAFNNEGIPIAETFVLSMMCWATGRILKHGIESLRWNSANKVKEGCHSDSSTSGGYEDFGKLCKELVSYIEKESVVLKGEGKRATKKWLDDFVNFVARKCLIGDIKCGVSRFNYVQYIAKCFQIKSNSIAEAKVVEADSMINSFFINDLLFLGQRAPRFGKGLLMFLEAPKSIKRIDLRTSEGIARSLKMLQPDQMPSGCWPSDHPLVFSQQFAINEIWSRLANNRGLFAINGPPGTGKTTLLRDLVAAIVVKRATDLANKPKIFKSRQSVLYNEFDGREICFYEFINGSSILESSIVVASANNSAVENISFELPACSSVPERLKEQGYFKELATLILRKQIGSNNNQIEAWGLLAARLGSRQNRNTFINSFWQRGSKKPGINFGGEANTEGLFHHLNDIVEGRRLPLLPWGEAVLKFKEAQNNEKSIRGRISREKAKLIDQRQLLDDEIREKSSPYMTEEWRLAREKLFLSALDLHRAFIESNARTMILNFDLVYHWLKGVSSSKSAARTALSTLCLVTPVISTTFASVSNMFADIGQEEIGWLLIDEAGQACPQQAVGAIWRAKRTIVVGDPNQLEPVINVPHFIRETLAKHYKIEERWQSTATSVASVQTIADQAIDVGTWLLGTGKDARQWVSCPLRVHRRCDNPMFSISNKISYDNMMVLGKPSLLDDFYLPSSCWIHVASRIKAGNWIEGEGEVAEHLLKFLISQGVEKKSIFVITPFRDCAKELFKIGRSLGLDTNKVGTIHTAQGKEANVVILVLGGRGQRAIDWAASKPNLLNVAVSRAKKRLYVIGNITNWGDKRFFNVLSSDLPQRTIHTFDTFTEQLE